MNELKRNFNFMLRTAIQSLLELKEYKSNLYSMLIFNLFIVLGSLIFFKSYGDLINEFLNWSLLDFIKVLSVENLDGSIYQSGQFVMQGEEVKIKTPSSMLHVNVLCALSPAFNDTSTSLPEALEVYIDAIQYGALWILKRMPGVEWHEPVGADLAMRQFESRKVDAKQSLQRSFRVKQRAFI